MAERISGEARAAVVRAQEQARRLGQDFVGCEHLLYGVAGADDAAGSVLRARGVTPERVEAHVAALISRSLGHGRGRTAAAHSSELDRGALEAIGIDIDAVRARVEEAFGPGSLDRAAAPRRNPTREGHLRVTRQARRCLDRSMREAAAYRTESPSRAESRQAASTRTRSADAHGAAHIALSLLAMDTSVTRSILSSLGVSAPQLTAEIRTAL